MAAQAGRTFSKQNKSTTQRRSRGFVQTGGLLSGRVQKVSEKRGFTQVKLLTQWVEIVGETVAEMARPVKVSYSKSGIGATLTVLTQGAQAPELQMMLPQIQEKVNACYGYNAISRITITQTADFGFGEAQAEFTPKPAATQSEQTLTRQQSEAVRKNVSPIADSGLRDALEQLGQNILKR